MGMARIAIVRSNNVNYGSEVVSEIDYRSSSRGICALPGDIVLHPCAVHLTLCRVSFATGQWLCVQVWFSVLVKRKMYM